MNCFDDKKVNIKAFDPEEVFSDESAEYRFPEEPEPGDTVVIRIRVCKGRALRVMLEAGDPAVRILMEKYEETPLFDRYRGLIVCGKDPVKYRFIIENEGGEYIFGKGRGSDYFSFTPGFHVPEWAKGAVQYQIFPDRFRNGNPSNDVSDNEYFYVSGHSRKIGDWNKAPDTADIRSFYGGDLQGILEKLDYIKNLGVTAIYLNPIFVSPSSHKYDVEDYEHVDPHLAVIRDDIDHKMEHWEHHNGYAPKYIRRVTSPENLSESDKFFGTLCEEIHKRGMRIILDGVFNHCGSFNKWMDREGIYLGKRDFLPGAYQSKQSPYREYFNFAGTDSSEYEGWWDYVTLPKLNYENSPELTEKIIGIAEKWASPPYSIDGWRLDVAADLGHSPDFNHKFWKEFRRRLKKINPELLIVAEHYGDPSPWLTGDEWDTVMNYDAFMDPLSFFLTGMEKHSDRKDESLIFNGEKFFENMFEAMGRLQRPSLLCAMNELSNHDHSRFLTRTNGLVGRLDSLGSSKASEGIDKAIFSQAVVIQMTWPGAPTIYYGDEAGQVGWTDPDSRRTYPWGFEDTMLINLHRSLAKLRNGNPVFKTGSLVRLFACCGMIAYARFNREMCGITACNTTDKVKIFNLNVSLAEVPDGAVFRFKIMTSEGGFKESCPEGCCCGDCSLNISLKVCNGRISFALPAKSSAVLISGGKDE